MCTHLENDYACRHFVSCLQDLTFYNTGPHIELLTEVARDVGLKYAAEIVFHVETYLQQVKPDLLLPGIFLIDSIIKNLGKEYVELFSRNVVQSFCKVCEKVDSHARNTLYEIRQTWQSFFPTKQLHAIDRRMNRLDHLWPVTRQFQNRRSNKVVKHFPIKRNRRYLQTCKIDEEYKNNTAGGVFSQFDYPSNRDRCEINYRANYNRRDDVKETKSEFDNSRTFFKQPLKNSEIDNLRTNRVEFEEPSLKRMRVWDSDETENLEKQSPSNLQDGQQTFPTVFFHSARDGAHVTTKQKFANQDKYRNGNRHHQFKTLSQQRVPKNNALNGLSARNLSQKERQWKSEPQSTERVRQKYSGREHFISQSLPSSERILSVELNSFRKNPDSKFSQKITHCLDADRDQRTQFNDFPANQDVDQRKIVDQRHSFGNFSGNSSFINCDIKELLRNLEEKENVNPSSPSNNSESSSKYEIISQFDFSFKCLRRRSDDVINQLHEGKPCASCGYRFNVEQQDEYRSHLDWHFKQNRNKKSQKGDCRNFYPEINSWIQFSEIDTVEEKQECYFEKQKADEKLSEPTAPVVCISATNNDTEISCAVCGDKFDIFWNDEEDDWQIKNASRVHDKIYHITCCEDA